MWALPVLTEEERETCMKTWRVSFDGRYFRYRDYRYERLDDALNYARLDIPRCGPLPADAVPPYWLAPMEPDAGERTLMAELGIGFDGRFYGWQTYRYEKLEDAVCYARRLSPVTAR